MKATYKLELEQQQRRLRLSHNQLNRLDRKHNDHNLIKKLQSLEVVASASAPPPPADTGFYGTIAVKNVTAPGGPPVSFQVKLAYNNVDITSYVTINGGQTVTITVPIGDRLPNPSSLLQLKIIFASSSISVNAFEDIVGFSLVSATTNPLTEENTAEFLIESGYIDNGELVQDIIVDSS
jgi:hypothetical protein